LHCDLTVSAACLALGLIGASFSDWHTQCGALLSEGEPRVRHGFFGAGTVGAALNIFVVPFLVSSYGWESVPKVYAVVLFATAALFSIFSAPDPGVGAGPSIMQQLSVLPDPRVWKYCQ
jgi:NNP family nitrate/nitrite transporter-like MFS transporter